MQNQQPLPGKPGVRYLFNRLASQTFDKDTLLFSSVCVTALLLVSISVLNTLYSNSQYVSLASSFLQGRLDFVDRLRTWTDTSLFSGKYYWPLGPLPAVLLIPFFLIFRYGADTGYFGLILTILVVWYLYKTSLVLGVSPKNARWLSFAFVFSTSLSYVNYFSTWPWYFSNLLSTSLTVLAIYEWFTRKRLFFVGLLVGLSMATRPVTCFAILSFSGLLLMEKRPLREKARSLLELLLPFGILGLAVIFYNYFRFGSFTEFGYTYQIMDGEALGTRNYGSWSFRHYPMNIYYLFFKGFDGFFIPGTKVLQPPFIRPDYWGTSIFFTSPILIFIVNTQKNNKAVRVFLLNALLILLVVLAYSNTGSITYGSRHVLDLFPLLFPALVTSFQEPLSGRVKGLVIFSFLFNFVMSLLLFTSIR